MKNLLRRFIYLGMILLAACQSSSSPTAQTNRETLGQQKLNVLVVESFLADIAQNVAGERQDMEEDGKPEGVASTETRRQREETRLPIEFGIHASVDRIEARHPEEHAQRQGNRKSDQRPLDGNETADR